MSRDPLFRPYRCVPILALVCVLGAGGCGSDPAAVGLVAQGLAVDSLSINNGLPYTRTTSVTLTLTTRLGNRPVTMCVTNAAACTPEPYLTTKRWLLDPTEGLKTVSVTLDDRRGGITALQATVTLDTTVPVAGALTATGSDNRVSLAWDPAIDAVSGVQRYRLMMRTAVAPTSCNDGQLLYQGTDVAYEHITARNSVTYGYRICPVDFAGNVGVGTTAVARAAPEFDPPTGTVTINTGALLTRLHSVTLDLTAADANPVTSVCISQTATCTNWVPWAATKRWELRGPDGLFTVNVWFRDSFMNVSAAPVSASITLDTLQPSLPVLSTIIGIDNIVLNWTAATDVNGIDSYTLVWVTGRTPPVSCSVGTLAYTGLNLTYTDTAGPPGMRTYRLCVTDMAGNVNTRAVIMAMQGPNALPSVIFPSTNLEPANAEPARAKLLDSLHLQMTRSNGFAQARQNTLEVVSDAIDDDTLELRAGLHATLGVSGLAQLYKWAEEADPAVQLFYKDHGIEDSDAKADAVYHFVMALIEEGARIDGIAIERDRGLVLYPVEEYERSTTKRFARLGVGVVYREVELQ